MEHLTAWYLAVSEAGWNNSAELKRQFRSASILSSERVVFNIKGNDYRLVVAVNYAYKLVLIKWLGTHQEYDKIDARLISFDKDRYAHPSH